MRGVSTIPGGPGRRVPARDQQLLSHTSGMPSFRQANEKERRRRPPCPVRGHEYPTALDLTATLPWEAREVGSFHYSGSGYLALGQLLERLRGKPYPQVLAEDVINPLQLKRTSVDENLREAADVIHGYISLRGERLSPAVRAEKGQPLPRTGSQVGRTRA